MPEQQKPPAIRTALIGLLGTILTVCGGLGGALVTSAVTIYEVQRQNEKVALPAVAGGETLRVDAGTIFITRQDAANLDPEKYYVNLERAFVLPRPLSGWSDLEEMTLQEQLAESSVTCQVVCDQPVFRIRHGDPVEIESDRASTVNGKLIPEDILNLSEALYGPPPWKLPYYNQLILNIFYKKDIESQGIDTLPDLIVLMGRIFSGQVNRIAAPENGHFALVQLSNSYANIRVNGEAATIIIDDWMLFAEAKNAFYTVEIRYTPQSGQSAEVWDDLQTYIDQFRVIE